MSDAGLNAAREKTGTPASIWENPLLRRVASALVLVAIALVVVWQGGWILAAWIVAVGARMAFEWERLVDARGLSPAFAMHAGTVAAAVILTLKHEPLGALAAIAIGTFAGMALAFTEKRDPLWPLAGIPYIALPSMAFMWVSALEPWGMATILWMLFTVWATDSGAWLVGKLLGGPKLWPSLSPKKTWAGSLGGLFFAGLFGFLVAWAVGAPAPLAAGLVSLPMSLIGQGGDLVESALKRRFHAKDAGTIIPGHGGVLDRLDSQLAVALATAILILIVPQGPLGLTFE